MANKVSLNVKFPLKLNWACAFYFTQMEKRLNETNSVKHLGIKIDKNLIWKQ